jgi:lysyl-tRNA synthetase class I
MYREPKAAKRLYFDVIPRNVDDYQQFLEGYRKQVEWKQRLGNPVWHIHSGNPPEPDMPVTFQMLLTLVSSSNAENAETLWGFIGRYRPGVTKDTHPKLGNLVEYAIHYFRDFVLPTKKFREPTEANARRSPTCATRSRNCRRTRLPNRFRMWSTRSAAASRSSITRRRRRTASRASRSTGSTCSIRCCSGRRKGRASARSSRYGIERSP